MAVAHHTSHGTRHTSHVTRHRPALPGATGSNNGVYHCDFGGSRRRRPAVSGSDVARVVRGEEAGDVPPSRVCVPMLVQAVARLSRSSGELSPSNVPILTLVEPVPAHIGVCARLSAPRGSLACPLQVDFSFIRALWLTPFGRDVIVWC
jgi:hypothetical protein